MRPDLKNQRELLPLVRQWLGFPEELAMSEDEFFQAFYDDFARFPGSVDRPGSEVPPPPEDLLVYDRFEPAPRVRAGQ